MYFKNYIFEFCKKYEFDITFFIWYVTYVYCSGKPIELLRLDAYDFYTLMGFVKAANENMFNIVILLTEMTILLTFILLAVLVALAYIIDKFNAENNPFPRHFEKSIESTLDVLFVVFPTIVILYLLIPSLGFIFNNELVVETMFDLDVIGHQWYWSYEYNLSFGRGLYEIYTKSHDIFNKIEFDSIMDTETTYNRLLQVDKRVIIPINTNIKVNVTSQDVIHSWAIPQLGVKYDAIPGRLISFILSSNILGIYYGQCSELCGVNHAFMPICVQCVEHEMFVDWVMFSFQMHPARFIWDFYFEIFNDMNNALIHAYNESIHKEMLIDFYTGIY